MIIKSVRVQNFRCIRDETLPCDRLTAIVGPNGSGKSAFLRALQLFYIAVARYSEEDFYARNTSQHIMITVTFTELTPEERTLFNKYVEAGELTVEKVMDFPSSKANQKYYGTSLRNPEFQAFRAATSAQERRQEYAALRENSKYSSLPSWTRQDDAAKALEDWEASNPEACSRQRDDGQFFGFTEVGEAHLERHTSFLLIPAVRDASEDAAEGRGLVLTELMDLVVRSALAERPELIQLREEAQERYDAIVDPEKLPELQNLGDQLTATLKNYAPEARVALSWLKGEGVTIAPPRANIKLVEDGYPTEVTHSGHGLQRAFILTMLQHLAVAQYTPGQPQGAQPSQDTGGEAGPLRLPNLILSIEEPELYLHPNRQRHLSRILFNLAMGGVPGVAERTQVIYSTHSPLFVDIERFDQVRRLRKVSTQDDLPKETRLTYTSLDEIARVIEQADAQPEGTYSGETLRPRLQALMTPWMSEGFFADAVVLVEGEEDRAAILGVAGALHPAVGQDIDLETLGISVIPCMGKNNLDRPAAIFRTLGIPIYIVWDSDCAKGDAKQQSKSKVSNHRLLRLCGEAIEDWPEGVSGCFACFKVDMGMTLRKEIGEERFDRLLQPWIEGFAYDKADSLKNPLLIRAVLRDAQAEGVSSPTLTLIVQNILRLKGIEVGLT
jgi:putative ATP-dependent endonuclease of OLD family